MWRYVLITLALVAAPLLQSTVLYHVAPGGASLDLVLLMTVAIGVTRGPLAGALTGLACGLLLGLIEDLAPVAFAASYAVVGVAAGFMRARTTGRIMLVAAACCILLGLCERVLLSAAPVVPSFPWREALAFIVVSMLFEVPAVSLVRRGLRTPCLA
jgi:hypothetical protein